MLYSPYYCTPSKIDLAFTSLEHHCIVDHPSPSLSMYSMSHISQLFSKILCILDTATLCQQYLVGHWVCYWQIHLWVHCLGFPPLTLEYLSLILISDLHIYTPVSDLVKGRYLQPTFLLTSFACNCSCMTDLHEPPLFHQTSICGICVSCWDLWHYRHILIFALEHFSMWPLFNWQHFIFAFWQDHVLYVPRYAFSTWPWPVCAQWRWPTQRSRGYRILPFSKWQKSHPSPTYR